MDDHQRQQHAKRRPLPLTGAQASTVPPCISTMCRTIARQSPTAGFRVVLASAGETVQTYRGNPAGCDPGIADRYFDV
jgi:hypothetical protein